MTPSPYLSASADISSDRLYRYALSRHLAHGERAVLFVGLNPSTADARTDDPTIRRCVGFARSWGFDWLLMGNVYALRSTDPKRLMLVEDAIGPLNQEALEAMTRRAELVVAAWGKNRLDAVATRLAGWILSLEHTRCLGENQDGSPKHPLYLRRETALRKPGRGLQD
jgi:hypothetical protein